MEKAVIYITRFVLNVLILAASCNVAFSQKENKKADEKQGLIGFIDSIRPLDPGK